MVLSRRTQSFLCAAAMSAVFLATPPAHADGIDRQAAKFENSGGMTGFLALGTALPLFTDGRQGRVHALRTADALGTSLLFATGLKALVNEKRPNSNAHDSFPSGDTTMSFSVATMESQFHPSQAPWWYAGATLIGLGRLTLHKHTAGDVIAGAALGFGTARLELSLPRGLILAPFIPRSDRGMGLKIGLRF